MFACNSGNSAIVSRLVEVPGLDINYQDEKYGDTAAHLASQSGHTEVVRILDETGKVNWNKRDKRGWRGDTPIMMALKGSKTEIVEILLRCPRVDLSCRDKEGWSLVFRAIQKKRIGDQIIY